jgi:murein DD-endopeptidase MepM/ murein hydrolase activator NlpD
MATAVFPLPRKYEDSYHNDFGDPRPGYPHEGTDLVVPRGVKIFSITDGEVLYSGWADKLGFETNGGNAVVIESTVNVEIPFGDKTVRVKKGDYFLYLHLQEPSPLRKGDKVKAGQPVGEVGDSSPVDVVPHLHLGWLRDYHSPQDRGARNPFPLLNALRENDMFRGKN